MPLFGPGSKCLQLPFILCIFYFFTMQNCSEGVQGLSVWLQKKGIFTSNSISLSHFLRQWNSRYAIHAGGNLPHKEFRYLRIIRVITAVYWGFYEKRLNFLFSRPNTGQASASIFHVAILQKPVFLLNSRCSFFSVRQ